MTNIMALSSMYKWDIGKGLAMYIEGGRFSICESAQHDPHGDLIRPVFNVSY